MAAYLSEEEGVHSCRTEFHLSILQKGGGEEGGYCSNLHAQIMDR